jgi:hypothetical protein
MRHYLPDKIIIGFFKKEKYTGCKARWPGHRFVIPDTNSCFFPF